MIEHNLSIYAHRMQSPSTVAFENKIQAFRALRSGLRHAHTNWRMWQNYMIVAIDVGELSESARAMTRLLEIQGNAIDVDVLDKLVDSVTRDDYRSGQGVGEKVVPTSSNEGFGLLPTVERLFDATILPKISDNARVWRAHGRLLRWKEDRAGAMEDYLLAYRCGPVSDPSVEREKAKFVEAVEEIVELVDVLSILGPTLGEVGGMGKKKGDWRFQARGIVRTFIGRTRNA